MRAVAAFVALAMSVPVGLASCSSEAVSCDAAIQRAHATIEARSLHTGDELWSSTTAWLHGATYDLASGELIAVPYGTRNGPTHLAVSVEDGSVMDRFGPAPFAGSGPLTSVTSDGVTVEIRQPVVEGTSPASGPDTVVATSPDGTEPVSYTHLRAHET